MVGMILDFMVSADHDEFSGEAPRERERVGIAGRDFQFAHGRGAALFGHASVSIQSVADAFRMRIEDCVPVRVLAVSVLDVWRRFPKNSVIDIIQFGDPTGGLGCLQRERHGNVFALCEAVQCPEHHQKQHQ